MLTTHTLARNLCEICRTVDNCPLLSSKGLNCPLDGSHDCDEISEEIWIAAMIENSKYEDLADKLSNENI